MEYESLKCPRCGGAEFEVVGENERLCWYCVPWQNRERASGGC